MIPGAPTLDLSEPGLGVLRFTIINMLDTSLTVGGYDPLVAFAGGDVGDDVGHLTLGPITSYVIAAKGSQVPAVFLANGHHNSALVVVHDVQEPSSLALTLGGLVWLAWAMRQRRRPPH